MIMHLIALSEIPHHVLRGWVVVCIEGVGGGLYRGVGGGLYRGGGWWSVSRGWVVVCIEGAGGGLY